jgi:hypothetical protein
MGYTHYWDSEPDTAGFQQARPELEQVIERHKDLLSGEGHEILGEHCIWFNGIDEGAHESFVFDASEGGWAFCKTAEKPYDLAVCECLLILKKHLKGFSFRSDGDIDSEPNWVQAKKNVES